MTTVGEPIEPEVWRWYHEVVGKREAVIVDTWWQTENGGFLGSTLPALQPMKPGSCGPGRARHLPGDLRRERRGRRGRQRQGRQHLHPQPVAWHLPDHLGPARAVRADLLREVLPDKNSTDWHDWPYLAGDGAVQAADGYFRILGRIDDVINVAGHRLGTKELESASLTVDEIAEAAAVPVIDELRGRAVEMYVALKPGTHAEPGHRRQGHRRHRHARSARSPDPKNVWIVPDMPKTRSGKIMRRVIAAISNFTDVGDVTTLANPEIVDDIRHHVQSEKLSRGETPRAAHRAGGGRDQGVRPSRVTLRRVAIQGAAGRPAGEIGWKLRPRLWGPMSAAAAGPSWQVRCPRGW